jgi:hypothetical protein
MDYEGVLISKIVIQRMMRDIIEFNLPNVLFVQHIKEWKYISEFYRTHGDSPPPSQFEKLFPTFKLHLEDSPLSFFVEELRKRRTHNLLTDAMKEAAPLIKSKKPEDALEIFKKACLLADEETRPARDLNLSENPMLRLEQYHEIRENGGITGLPSLWPALDEVTLGFQPEELWMIVARGGIGKTWMETILARFHWGLGYKPLLISKEMAVMQIARRFDAVHAKLG